MHIYFQHILRDISFGLQKIPQISQTLSTGLRGEGGWMVAEGGGVSGGFGREGAKDLLKVGSPNTLCKCTLTVNQSTKPSILSRLGVSVQVHECPAFWQMSTKSQLSRSTLAAKQN